MSGISGAFIQNAHADFNLPQFLEKANRILRHRGPDSEAFLLIDKQFNPTFCFGSKTPKPAIESNQLQPLPKGGSEYAFGFGQVQLSFNPKTTATQNPIVSKDGKYFLLFDGEIYNNIELAEELAKLGRKVSPDNTGLLIIEAYRQFGDLFSNRLLGMWALIIIDLENQKVIGSRDRFGVKPLYYLHEGGLLVMASELKALTGIEGVDYKLSRGAAFEYLINGTTEKENKTMLSPIMELMPGNSFSYNLNTHIFKYWSYFNLGYKPDFDEFSQSRFEKHSYRVRRLISSGMKMRLRNQVPFGTPLGGGMDSASLICMAEKVLKEEGHQFNGERQQTFTVSFKEKEFDESSWSYETVKQVNAIWHKIYPSGDELAGDLNNLVYAQDLPFNSLSSYAQYRVMQEIGEKGYKLTFDGHGADELFAGLPDHFKVFMTEMLGYKSYNSFILNFLVANNSFASRGEVIGFLVKLFYNRFLSSKPNEKSPDSRREFTYIREEVWERHHKKVAEELTVNLNAFLHGQYAGPQLRSQLRNTDRNSSAFGVLARVPFADDVDLVEYVFNIPAVYKIRYGNSKILLRSAMGNNLPARTLWRRDKIGFFTPDLVWMQSIKDPVREMISDNYRDMWSVKDLRKDWDSLFKRGKNGQADALWRMVNLIVWRQTFKV